VFGGLPGRDILNENQEFGAFRTSPALIFLALFRTVISVVFGRSNLVFESVKVI